jgi:hypothetical protein
MEDVSVNENGEPLGITPDTPTSAEPMAEAPAPTAPVEPTPAPAASSVPAEPWPAPVVPEPPLAEPVTEPVPEPTEPAPTPAPAEQLTIENAEAVAPIAMAAEVEPASADLMTEQDLADGLTGQLQALSESLGEPTDELAAAEGEAAPDGVAEVVEQLEEGTEAAVEAPEGAEATAEAAPAVGEAAAGVEPATESLDDIAPGTVTVAAAAAVEEAPDAALEEVEAPRTTVSWWPFIGYILVWLGAAGYAVWQLEGLPAGQAAYETNFYSTAMLVGLSLLAAGPVLILIVWLASWIGRKGARIGLMFISALLKGASATLIGAMIWIGALLLIDYLRLGRPF